MLGKDKLTAEINRQIDVQRDLYEIAKTNGGICTKQVIEAKLDCLINLLVGIESGEFEPAPRREEN